MNQVVIENPVINTPFEEPRRHFRFTEDGITNEIVDSRRISSYFIPVPRPRKKGRQQQLPFSTEWTEDRLQENEFINQLRGRVSKWRRGGYMGITRTTSLLLEYWQRPDRELKLFFCQIEALETLIYITEAAKKYGDAWIENALRRANEDSNPLLFRMAFKMATGSGKTVVMAMLISWHVLNKNANRQDARFSDAFLIVTPGITIRDRLRVLLPNDPQNYYKKMDVVPPDLRAQMGAAKIIITNFHAFKLKERQSAGRLTKNILSQEGASPFTETPAQMVRRVCRDLGNKRNIVVINDEAHHCYRRKSEGPEEKLKGDERVEVQKREEAARIWISGLEAAKEKLGVKSIYDLSATPFFLRGSGYPEGTLFPWVVSDFSLIDAIECGIVKVPRVPIADDSMTGEQPTYRDLWPRIREHLPKKGRKTKAVTGEPKLPVSLEGALKSLYDNYEKYYRLWEQNTEAQAKGLTPPVFIVVCNNTNVSKLVYDYVAGWEKTLQDGSTVIVPGKMPVFRNEQDNIWSYRPNTILIDSEQLESGEAMSPEFKKIAVREIEEFKAEYRARFPGREVEKLTDEDLLREVMNTVGKAGKLGEPTILTLDELRVRRMQEVAFLLAKLTLEKYFHDDHGNDRPWLFPQLLSITKQWLNECVVLKDNVFPQLLLLVQFAHNAADRIYRSIVAAESGEKTIKPILYPYETTGSTRYVDFDTIRPTYKTAANRCHISHVVADTGSWEQKMAEALEDMKEVCTYVKNHNLGFNIPYTIDGQERSYYPDFLVRLDDGLGRDDPLKLIIEVTGEKKKDKEEKVATARLLWVPAVNNHGGFGRWAFLEITDPWDAKSAIRDWLSSQAADHKRKTGKD